MRLRWPPSGGGVGTVGNPRLNGMERSRWPCRWQRIKVGLKPMRMRRESLDLTALGLSRPWAHS